MYEMNIRVRYSEINKQKQVDLSQIVNYFQDCSTFHSEDVGYGIDVLEELGKVWFLCGWQVEVERYPKFGEKLTIATWPYDRNDLYAYRNFVMIDEKGNTIAKANSIWFLVDIGTEKPVRITENDVIMYGMEEKLSMNYSQRKIKIFGELEQREGFPILKAHIDTNGHVNNSQYIQFAQEYIPSDFVITSMRVDYKKAAKLGEQVIPYICNQNQTCTIKLCDSLQKPYVVIEFCGYYREIS